jgi:hypothetical protein
MARIYLLLKGRKVVHPYKLGSPAVSDPVEVMSKSMPMSPTDERMSAYARLERDFGILKSIKKFRKKTNRK